MKKTTTNPSDTYQAVNILINKTLRRKFGKVHSVKISAIKFIENSTNPQYNHPKFITDEVYLKSKKANEF